MINKEKESLRKNNKEFDIKEIYTSLSEAKKEIQKRWNDKGLRKKVEDFLGGDVPSPFKKEPRAVLSRSIMTPNQELHYFIDLAKIAKLKPLGLEGVEDKFCTKNYDKVSLGKLSFLDGKEAKNNIKNNECKKNVINVIDMMAADGKRFCDINTLWGENLVDFHHRMLTFHNSEIETFDDFRWFNHKKGSSEISQYYKKFFTFFLCHGVLFENFITKRNEKEFTDNVVIESFLEVKEFFGESPLIVPLLPIEDDDHWYFRSYIK